MQAMPDEETVEVPVIMQLGCFVGGSRLYGLKKEIPHIENSSFE
jgi:hypothetical protein